ncbi:related to peroxisomal serine-active lipase [Ramularia collo-cygni]|uniref:Related to peroxisomal serine-active lipase n=1 Tax=Ramularia collo-cygni TaxID=112498 RepID=A0A2D3VS55_9PEZI|nr:related to peroxisomal serine-active lipase [Ramularia collo-cygni]CZT25348.1 related to peroxisomal serine-active lipase [Ramularia collo-cygni]
MPLRTVLPSLTGTKWGLVVALTVVTLPLLAEGAKICFDAIAIKSATKSDPSLFKDNLRVESYTTPSGHTYRRVRTFYRKHTHTEKLPRDLPLLVFIHGMGGSMAQFGPLLNSLINVAPCLAIDLPGCGASSFSPRDIKAYTPACLAELVHAAIERVRAKYINQQVVLIGHSYGCSLAALLASSKSPLAHLCSNHIIGMVAICPRSTPLVETDIKKIKTLNWIPSPMFAAWRLLDRRGGVNSTSVTRMAGKNADPETRRLQLRFNQQSRTPTWMTMTLAMAEQEQRANHEDSSGISKGIWADIEQPIFIVAARDDDVTKPTEAEQLNTWLTSKGPQATVKLLVFDSPASHSVLFSPRTIRSLSGHIETFLASEKVDPRLCPGWQLQQLTTTAKWDVKNLEKWSRVDPCSAPIACIFRAMKTMRQGDENHRPEVFIRNFGGEDGVRAVVDISRDQPVYNKADLEEANIEYHKFPTVSKIVPTDDDVSGFCALIDRLRKDFDIDGQREGRTIGVHCHYGFNRTGFLIITYLVLRLGWKVQDAIAEFESKRPPGIKHPHFIDDLFMRYGPK